MKKILLFVLFLWLVLSGLILTSGISSNGDPGSKQNNCIFIFQVTDYNSKISDAVEYIFNNMVKPNGLLSIFSPVKPYSYSEKTRNSYSTQKLIEMTKKVLKRDISIGTANYNQILNNMYQIVFNIAEETGTSSSGSMLGSNLGSQLKGHLVSYRQLLENLNNLRKLNEDLFLKLAEIFKKQSGKNYIYILYQKEYRIIPSRDTMNVLKNNIDVRFDASEVFEQDNIKEFMDTEKVSNVLKESSVILNFIYINKQLKRKRGTQIKEFSGDIYNVFSKIAKATGGMVETTVKSEAALKKITKAMN